MRKRLIQGICLLCGLASVQAASAQSYQPGLEPFRGNGYVYQAPSYYSSYPSYAFWGWPNYTSYLPAGTPYPGYGYGGPAYGYGTRYPYSGYLGPAGYGGYPGDLVPPTVRPGYGWPASYGRYEYNGPGYGGNGYSANPYRGYGYGYGYSGYGSPGYSYYGGMGPGPAEFLRLGGADFYGW